MKTSLSKNRRPLKWTHTEEGKYHVYTYTSECGCGIESVRYNTNHFVMSNSAGFHEVFESYKGMQNEAAQMIDEDDYHQFEWILPDGTIMQQACQFYADDNNRLSVEVELSEFISPSGMYIWWRADHQKHRLYEAESAGGYRVLGDCIIERDGITETWLLNYQQPYYDSDGNWDGWYYGTTSSPKAGKSLPYKADSYHSARLLAANWLAQQSANPTQENDFSI